MRHEEQIVRNAYKTAEIVRRTGKSRLLDPMNPFERRLVHTALNDFEGVETKSEGEGLYKQVRIIPVKYKNIFFFLWLWSISAVIFYSQK